MRKNHPEKIEMEMTDQILQDNDVVVKSGNYDAEVIAIDYAKGHPRGTAIDVFYKLWDYNHEGYTFTYFDRYMCDKENKKNSEFFDYLKHIGISRRNIKKYVGVNEILVLKNDNGNVYTVHRAYVGKPCKFKFKMM